MSNPMDALFAELDRADKAGPAESSVEGTVTKYAESLGWLAYKFTSPGKRGVLDHLYFNYGVCIAIEFKAKGKKPSKQQIKRREELKSRGIYTAVVDNITDGKIYLNRLDRYLQRRGVDQWVTEFERW